MSAFRYKAGDTLDLSGPVLVSGLVQDMTGWTITLIIATAETSQLSGSVATHIATVPGVWVDPVTAIARFTVAKEVTATWVLSRLLLLEIQLLAPTGELTTSQVMAISVDNRLP